MMIRRKINRLIRILGRSRVRKFAVSICFLMASLIPCVCPAELQVYFRDIGQGDCAILIADGEAMIIDGGGSYWSRTVYSYVKDTLKIESFRYMLATHPHEDHVGGLLGAMNAAPADTLLTPVTDWNQEQFREMMLYAERMGTQIIVPVENDQFMLGGAMITVLATWPEAWSENDLSIVVRVDYGETSFLFTGDAENYLEYILIDSGADLHVDVLKVGHHGSLTSSSQEFLEAVRPKYAVISCGRKNVYQHPKQETLIKLDMVGAQIMRTDLQGTIIFHSDGKELTYTTERKTKYESILISPEFSIYDDLQEGSYVGNSYSKKFHRLDCEYGQAISERNLVVFESREAAIEAEYSPCGACKP